MASRQPQRADAQPTIVLVRGAFADASSREGVIERLQQRGYTVVASISGGIGHNLPQGAPRAFAEAVLEVGGGVA
jgi:hypothetical protein